MGVGCKSCGTAYVGPKTVDLVIILLLIVLLKSLVFTGSLPPSLIISKQILFMQTSMT